MSVNPYPTNIMCRKILATVVALFIVNLICIPSLAQKKQLSVDEAKAEIAKLGTGPKAVVRITLKDNKKIQGSLTFAGDDHFTVTDEKSGALTDIKYLDVKQIKSLKPSTGLKVGLWAAVVVGSVLLLALIGLSTKNR